MRRAGTRLEVARLEVRRRIHVAEVFGLDDGPLRHVDLDVGGVARHLGPRVEERRGRTARRRAEQRGTEGQHGNRRSSALHRVTRTALKPDTPFPGAYGSVA